MSNSEDQSSSILNKWNALKRSEKEIPNTKYTSSRYIASKGQQRLYFLDQLNPNNPVYNLTEIWNLSGDFDPALFIKALQIVGDRQDLLRATFHLEDEDIICTINKEFNYQYEFIDLLSFGNDEINNQLQTIARKTSSTIFSLSDGPLLRLTICKWQKQAFQITVNVHHIISDKWSMRIIRHELSRIYKKLKDDTLSELVPIECQYADYVQEEFKKQHSQKSISYWKENLSELNHQVTIPFNTNQSKNISKSGRYSKLTLSTSLHKNILVFCKQEKITSFIFFLTIFKIVINKYTSINDVVVGTPTSKRTKQEYEKVVGFFNDTIVLRSQINEEDSFIDFLSLVKKNFYTAFGHRDIGFEKILSEVNPLREEHVNPIFQLMFLYHKEFEDHEFADSISIDVQNYDMGVAKFDLTLYISERSNGFELIAEYSTDLYTEDYIQQLLKHVQELTEQSLYNANIKISNLSCIGLRECDELIKLSSGPTLNLDYSQNWINRIFQNTNPSSIALTDEFTSITYSELNKRSNQIAHEILEQEGQFKTIVILLDQSVEFIIAMIGILKARAAYLPIDISYPLDHIRNVIEDSEAQMIISHRKTVIPKFNDLNYIYLDDVSSSQSNINTPIDLESTAYVIYTSGSTGKPNGVKISHNNLLNSTLARFEYYDDHPTAFLMLSSFSFDSSVAGIYWTLMNGGNVVIPQKRSIQDLDLLSTLISLHQISHTLLIPSLYLTFLEHIPTAVLGGLKLVIVAGEVLTKNIAVRHLESHGHVKFYNEYGPTEATVWSSVYQIKSIHEKASVPIGGAIANTTLFVLDHNLNMVPVGVTGELYVAGPSVSKGYLNSPEKTKDKFITKVFSNREYKLYKTGDLVKWDSDHQLIFFGRRDHQVKIRGYRIELGEIDKTILSFKNDIQSATIYDSEKKKIVAFIISSQAIDVGLLSTFISKKLPKQYIPDLIVQLEKFPLMSNGKIDYNALQKHKGLIAEEPVKKNNTLPSTHSSMLSIWRDILQRDDLTVEDNFFEAGGDSIQIIQIVARARKAGYTIDPKDIYTHQSVAELNVRSEQNTPSIAASVEWELMPLSPIQEWFFDIHLTNPHHWLQGYSISLSKSMSLGKAKEAIWSLISEYDIFQTSFVLKYGQWFHEKCHYGIEDFIYIDGNIEELKAQFNISTRPLAQFILHSKNGELTSLQIIIHHLIVDAVSWNIIFSYLDNRLSGRQTNTAKANSQYFHWVKQQNFLSRTRLFDSRIPFWNSMIGHQSKFLSKAKISIEKDIKNIHTQIDKVTTENIIKSCWDISSLKMEEALIASFLQVFYDNTKETELTIMIEKHGRSAEENHVDLTESIGWHTSYFPVNFILSNPTQALKTLLDVKEQLRKVPDNGQSYGILNYLSNKLDHPNKANIVMNYLGNLGDSNFNTFSKIEFIKDGMRDEFSERDYLIEINSWINNGVLELSYSFDKSQLSEVEMSKWCSDFTNSLINIPSSLAEAAPIQTPSDFKYTFSQEDLNTIFKDAAFRNHQIQDIISLSSIQSALLFHNLQTSSQDQGLITASANINGDIEFKYLQGAWNHIVNSHDVLRSYFLWEGLSKPAQVICRSVVSNIELVQLENKNSSFDDYISEWLTTNIRSELDLSEPPMYKLVCFKMTNRLSRIVFICHHIYLDGWSTFSLFNDLTSIASTLQSNEASRRIQNPSLAKWKSTYDRLKSRVDTISFWEYYLKGIEPSFLKQFSNSRSIDFELYTLTLDLKTSKFIRQSLAESKIGINAFFIGVWSWLLTKYLKNPKVVIGLTRSGRSLPIENMDSLIGMFSTVLPFKYYGYKPDRIDFKQVQASVNEFLERDAINLDDISLSDNQRWSKLFDTLLIMQNFIPTEIQKNELFLSDFTSKISSLIPLSLIVIPNEEIDISFRFQTDLYSLNEIKTIGDDLMQAIKKIRIQNAFGYIECSPVYSPDEKLIQLLNSQSTSSGTINNMPATESTEDLSFEEKLQHIWMAIMQKTYIDIDENFFHLGGTSLMAVRLFNKIKKDMGIHASPILLIKHNTIRRLSKALDQDSVSQSWSSIYPLKEGKTLAPLFCFHAGEGHVLFYKELAESIHKDRPVYGVQPRGLNGAELQFDSIEDMSAFYISEMKKVHPHGPYHLLGTCFSNAVTFEIAKQIQGEVGSLFIVDSPPPYFNELSKLSKWMHWVITFNIGKLSEAFNNYFKYSMFKKPIGDQDKDLFNTGKQLREVMSRYKWVSRDIDIILLRSSQNASDKYKNYHVSNWNQLTNGALRSVIVDGEHVSLFEKQSAIKLAEEIDKNIHLDDE